MADPETEQRIAKQRQALQVYGGARVDPVYIHRELEYVSVSRSDLADFKELDTTAMVLWTGGNFFAAGAAWLFVEHAFEADRWDMQLSFCTLAVLFGAVLAFAGWRMHAMKRRRIEVVFNQQPSEES